MPPPQRSDISSKHLKYYQDDYLVLHHYMSFTQMLSIFYIYMSLTKFIQHVCSPQHLRIFQHIEQYQHGDCRILADGMRIWNLECCYCITPVLDGRPRPSYPSHSFRACLHSFLLDSSQPHPMPVIGRNFIWMFRPCIKLSLPPAAVPSR